MSPFSVSHCLFVSFGFFYCWTHKPYIYLSDLKPIQDYIIYNDGNMYIYSFEYCKVEGYCRIYKLMKNDWVAK